MTSLTVVTLLNLNHFLIKTKAELCLKGTFVKVSFIFVTIFLDTYQNPPCPKHRKIIELKNGISFIFTLLRGATERFHLFEAPKRSVRIKNLSFSRLIQLGRQGLRQRFAELTTYAISFSLTIGIHKNNIDTFRVTSKQYHKIIPF